MTRNFSVCHVTAYAPVSLEVVVPSAVKIYVVAPATSAFHLDVNLVVCASVSHVTCLDLCHIRPVYRQHARQVIMNLQLDVVVDVPDLLPHNRHSEGANVSDILPITSFLSAQTLLKRHFEG